MAGTTTTEADRVRTVQVTNEALAALPKTGEEIAAFFQVRGIRGDHLATTCPMAVYLRGELAKAGLDRIKAYVTGYSVIMFESTRDDDYYTRSGTVWEARWDAANACPCCPNPERELPEAVTEFVTLHDRGKFREIDTAPHDVTPKPVPVAV